ncbi:MAG TPA: ATP synthase F1 subunit epsilon [Planctomycetota bacterium]|jgi:F-type H+-transporting ATPase subunit epsilon|nr:ATP synthase F1 subunit epsilon [Planctomycetota bacterium]OQC21219.1 MAG: ATP synthase epsilon chain [Planctomycetes bacterium ADurb.Bin069]NMD35832.1 ATP synthase F1 subunit epsilon [Planctomycetota bacterium]HNR99104.1 ATP synthase F1 subunit epsilon [Planctomycetota bacterium]HNU25859.1 ATP synthase F1 subunit epsilon [Planctomycetota bacterium]
MAEHLRVVIATPEKAVFEGTAVSLVIPAEDGSLGIMRDHARLIGRVGSGLLEIAREGGDVRFFACGGFFMVADNAVKILVDRACPPEELDLKEATERLERARAMPATTDREYRAAYTARRNAEGEIRAATRA